jgi:parallel beta-helix repeat protein
MFLQVQIKRGLSMRRFALMIAVFVAPCLFFTNHTLLLGLAHADSSRRFFYVATNGNDQWSGTIQEPNIEGNDGPLATLKQARDTIRRLRKNSSNDAFTILVRGGIYQLDETFDLEIEDSGTASNPLVIKAFENERPILTGTKRIIHFEPYEKGIYQTNLTKINANIEALNQLFVNGKRQILARYPNFEPSNPIGGGFLYVEGSAVEGSKRKFKYTNGTVHDWSNLQKAQVFIFPGDNWANSIQTGFEIDRNSQIITLTQDASYEIKAYNRYFFQNLFEELDTPGEWYFDSNEKVLYYWPVNISSLESATIPVLETIVRLKGKKVGDHYYGSPSYITFEGFTIEGCEGSAVVANGAKGAIFARNIIYNAGGHGIDIQDGLDNVVVGNDIFEVGKIGVSISGGDFKTLSPGNNRVENNYIHNTGVFVKWGASGILCKGVGNIVSHNLIHSTPRVGIWFDGNDHLIEYNHVHHVNEETEDSGMIYFSQIDWTKRGNIVQFNYLHDSGGYSRNKQTGKWESFSHTYGIYLDDWSSGTQVYGNIVANTANGAIFIHSGRDNNIENNIISEGGRLGQMVYSAWPPDTPTAQKWLPVMFTKSQEAGSTKYSQISTIKDVQTGAKMSGNSFVRNIVYYTGKDAVLYGIFNDIDLATTISDYNTIYHAGLPLLVPFMKVSNDLQWAKWQANGLDKNSKVADPLFLNFGSGQFQLSPDSPALKLGFKPIPFEKIGPYKDPLRASWPLSPNLKSVKSSIK